MQFCSQKLGIDTMEEYARGRLASSIRSGCMLNEGGVRQPARLTKGYTEAEKRSNFVRACVDGVAYQNKQWLRAEAIDVSVSLSFSSFFANLDLCPRKKIRTGRGVKLAATIRAANSPRPGSRQTEQS